MDWLGIDLFIPQYVKSGQMVTDFVDTLWNWGSSVFEGFTKVGHQNVQPVIMVENILDFISYGLTGTGIICLGIVCYRVMCEEGFGFQIRFEAGPRGWGRSRNQVLSIAPVVLDDAVAHQC